MAITYDFTEFRDNAPFKNKYLREVAQIWNANLHHQDIRPFACPEKKCEGNYETIYPIPECECLGFEDEIDITIGYRGDEHYLVRDSNLYQATAQQLCDARSLDLAGTPTPTTDVVAEGSCSDDDGVATSYVITYITEFNGRRHEGSPSRPSYPVPSQGNIPNVTVSWGAPPAGYNIVATRLYRTIARYDDGQSRLDAQVSEWVMVQEFSVAARSFFDNVPEYMTGQPLMTYAPSMNAAPAGECKYLTRTEDGLVVASDYVVYLSIPGTSNFAADFTVDINHKILGIYGIRQYVLVLTERHPVIINYSLRAEDNSERRRTIQRDLPLTSKKSAQVVGDTLIFATDLSLYQWDLRGYGADTEIIVRELISPEQWKNIDPYTVVGVGYELGYMFSSDNIDYSIMMEFGRDKTDTDVATQLMGIDYINPKSMATDYSGKIWYNDGIDTFMWDWRREGCNFYNVYDNIIVNPCSGQCKWRLQLFLDNKRPNTYRMARAEFDERSTDKIDFAIYHSYKGKTSEIYSAEITAARGFGIPIFSNSQDYLIGMESTGIMTRFTLATSYKELGKNGR